MLTLAQIRAEKSGDVGPKGFKAWYTKNKGIVLIGGGVVIVGGAYLGYRYIFKKKQAITSSMGMDGGGAPNLEGVKIDAVEFK